MDLVTTYNLSTEGEINILTYNDTDSLPSMYGNLYVQTKDFIQYSNVPSANVFYCIHQFQNDQFKYKLMSSRLVINNL